MELQVKPYTMPEALEFNYEEIKAELTEKIHFYKTVVYTDEQIKDAKNDRANLNRLKKALNDERIRRQKEYMQPFDEFKKKIDEIIAIIDEPAAIIDQRVKDYELQKQEEKKSAVKELFDSLEFPEFVTLEKVFDAKWLNASTSMASIKASLEQLKAKTETDLDSLSNMPEFSFEACETYKRTLDFAEAVKTANRLVEMARLKREAEEKAARQAELDRIAEQERKEREAQQTEEAPVEVKEEVKEEAPSATWIKFEAYLTKENALKLNEFFKENKIAFKAI